MIKLVFGVANQVRNKQSSTATEDGSRLTISYLESTVKALINARALLFTERGVGAYKRLEF